MLSHLSSVGPCRGGGEGGRGKCLRDLTEGGRKKEGEGRGNFKALIYEVRSGKCKDRGDIVSPRGN